ncbi:hypothetical protein [Haloarchaeobius salinus]|uniref:hypothetical protein n=1 Tax=Haloarchaeobius salinus TaxID=1198298 RepID=UPI00210ED1BA|nr:hypothetical protein [Haloarchaeobius salinus]
MAGDDDRGRGILSPADRAYLRGETELGSVQSERNTRARIRDRVHDALFDFELLVEALDDRDRDLVAERLADGEGTESFDGLVAAVAFLYRITEETGLDFETVLREGVNVAEAPEGRAATVDLELTFHGLTVEGLRARLERGEELSLTELAVLHDSDAVRPDELAAYFGDDDPTGGVDDGRIQSKVTNF